MVPGPRGPRIAPGPLPRSDSRSRGPFPPASCLITPWFTPGTGVLTWLADQLTGRPSLRGPARRSEAAAAYSTNGLSSTSYAMAAGSTWVMAGQVTRGSLSMTPSRATRASPQTAPAAVTTISNKAVCP